MSEEIKLTSEQEQKILNEWNRRPTDPPSLQDLIKAAFGSEINSDGRSIYAKAVRAFLASRKMATRSQAFYKPKGVIELSPEQKEYVINNSPNMSYTEMAQVIFNNRALGSLSQEARSVAEFQKTLPKQVFFEDPNESPDEYKPPNTVDRAVARINKYVHDIEYKANALNPKQRKDVEALIAYMHDYRYLHQIRTYVTETERALFESSFIKYTFDKPDLTKEDLDQYIVLCIEVVMSANIQKTMNMLQLKQDDVVKGDDKLAIALVEAIGNTRDEYNSSVERQQKLFKSLTAERSKRLQDKIQKNATILNLVEAWKEEEDRKVMLHTSEIRKKLVADTVDQMEKWEDIKCRVFGLSKEEVLNG